jgi:CheY-like chemotaxis protein
MSGTVLVVEDEALIRMSAVELFENLGCVVLEAGDAEEALSILRAHPGIDFLFTDIDMPGDMNGVDLIHVVKQHWRGMKIMVASATALVDSAGLDPDVPRFTKPYDVDRILTSFMSLRA